MQSPKYLRLIFSDCHVNKSYRNSLVAFNSKRSNIVYQPICELSVLTFKIDMTKFNHHRCRSVTVTVNCYFSVMKSIKKPKKTTRK